MTTYVSGSETVVGSSTLYSAANWQEYVRQIRAGLSGVGLVQTSDTGQLNPATTTAASNNTNGGYEIWRFTDAAQATDPVFIKIMYRRYNNQGAFGMQIQVGEGSNGSGTLTGQLSGNFDHIGEAVVSATSGTGQTYAYFGDGCFWIANAVASTTPAYSGAPRICWSLARTRNLAGSLDARGLIFHHNVIQGSGAYGSHSFQFVRRAAGLGYTGPTNTQYCMIVGSAAPDYAPGTSNPQSWPHFYYDPGVGVRTCWHQFSIRRDVGSPTSPTAFNADPFGTGSRRWITWRWAPWSHHRFSSFAALVLPWEV